MSQIFQLLSSYWSVMLPHLLASVASSHVPTLACCALAPISTRLQVNGSRTDWGRPLPVLQVPRGTWPQKILNHLKTLLVTIIHLLHPWSLAATAWRKSLLSCSRRFHFVFPWELLILLPELECLFSSSPKAKSHLSLLKVKFCYTDLV